MIIDHRTYTVHHGRMEEYLERYEREGLPIQLRHLGQYVGCFVSEIGPLNQVTHIWAYESLADREARRERMARDPEWKKFKIGNRGFFLAQEVKVLVPAKFSPLK
ncbi:MAG: NIPSNAP family protein [Bryobacteraceae bacterium]